MVLTADIPRLLFVWVLSGWIWLCGQIRNGAWDTKMPTKLSKVAFILLSVLTATIGGTAILIHEVLRVKEGD
jgi:hypothetical protein